MNFGEIKAFLKSIVRDQSLAPHFDRQINGAISEISAELELPDLKIVTPFPLSVDKTNWLWQMPDAYHKMLYEVRRSGEPHWRRVHICDHIEELNYRDPEHKRIGPHVEIVAVADQGVPKLGQRSFLGIHPLPWQQETLQLWFYRKPTILVDEQDICDCIPPEFVRRVIIPKCIVMNFEAFTDGIEDGPMRSLPYWENKYLIGLNGESRGESGLKDYIAKRRGGPKRTGGRDPIGARRRYGS